MCRLVSNVKRAVCYIVPCVLLAVLLNLSKFFETETVRFCLDFTACGCGYHYKLYVRPTRLRLSQNYIMWYTTWTWVSTTSIIPFLTLLVLNIIIYRKLKEAKAVSARLNASQQNQVHLFYPIILFMKHATNVSEKQRCVCGEDQSIELNHSPVHRGNFPSLPFTEV